MSDVSRPFSASWVTWETGEEFCMQIDVLPPYYGVDYAIVLRARDNEPPSCSVYYLFRDYDLKDINREFFTNWAEEAQDPDATARRYRGNPDPDLDLTCKALKFVLDPAQLARVDPAQLARGHVPNGGEYRSFRVTTANGRIVYGCLNSKNACEAIARIAELGADNVTVILQGELLTESSWLESADLSVQPKTGM